MKAYAEVMASEIPGLLDQIVLAPRCVRPKATGLLISQDLRLSDLRTFARLNRCRMREAARAGNDVEFLRAMEHSLALARHASRQAWIIDRLVAHAILANTIDEVVSQTFERDMPASTCRAAIALLQKYSGMPPASHPFNGEEIWALDAVQSKYSDDGHGNGWVLSQNSTGSFEITNMIGLFHASKKDVVRAAEKAYEEMRRLADAPREARAGMKLEPTEDIYKTGSRYKVLEILMPAWEKTIASTDQIQMHLGGAMVVLGIEAHRREHAGTPPASIDALVPEILKELPRDPFASDGRIRYRLLDAPDDEGRRWLVYSVAADGQDDGGKPAAKDRYGAFSPKGSGSDFVVNESRPSLTK